MTPAFETHGSPPHRRERGLIDRHFAGRVAPHGERRMRAHLVDCGDCRGHYERHLRLAAVDPQAAVPRRERLARGLGLAAASSGPVTTRRWFAFAATAAAACTVALLVIGLPRTSSDSQPRAGGVTPGSQLLVYELTAGGVRQAVSELRAGSALAFAYANITHRRHLLVFAVDETRRVYWFHPAWQKLADNPVAIDIAPDEALHELPQAISHRFTGRHLQIFGVFVDRALSVLEIEALVARAPWDQLHLDIAEADVTRLDVTVSDR
jgi:hypothetical protein